MKYVGREQIAIRTQTVVAALDHLEDTLRASNALAKRVLGELADRGWNVSDLEARDAAMTGEIKVPLELLDALLFGQEWQAGSVR
jgi:hypothetical protein